MIRLRFITSLVLLTVLLAACAPGTSTEAPAQPVVIEASQTPGLDPVESTTGGDPAVTSAPELHTATAPVEAQPAATSRGPDLHATDPTTVSLASGGLQLVEFFRFT